MAATNGKSVADLARRYGEQGSPTGILSELVYTAEQRGGTLRTLGNGAFVVVDENGRAWPVICSELVPVPTEDGTITGRCGLPVVGLDGYACAGHTAEIDGWRNMSEAEKLNWERENS